MKLTSKLAVATLFALTAAAPALAGTPESLTYAERNTYLYTADARPIFQDVQGAGTAAFAQAPVQAMHHGIDLSRGFDNFDY